MQAASSEEAAEILRVERGRPRYGVDLDDAVIPQEAALNERAGAADGRRRAGVGLRDRRSP